MWASVLEKTWFKPLMMASLWEYGAKKNPGSVTSFACDHEKPARKHYGAFNHVPEVIQHSRVAAEAAFKPSLWWPFTGSQLEPGPPRHL